jgi:spore coat protein H
MNVRFLSFVGALLLAVGAPASPPGETFFTNRAAHFFEIEISRSNIAALRREPREYVPALVRCGGVSYTNVGAHIKGVATFRPIDDKPSLTLNFSKFAPKQRFHGLRKIHLNNGKEDPSFLCEAISAEMFAEAGLPVARVTHASARLNGRELGAYAVIEGFTAEFLERYFTQTKGNLYDSGFRKDVTAQLEKLSGKKPHDGADLQQLAAAARTPDLTQRWERLARSLDTNNFARYLAMQVLTANWDGYAMYKNNYRIYHDPTSDRLFFMPHGMDQMFARPTMPMVPVWQGMVANAFMETSEGQALYQQNVTTLYTNTYKTQALVSRIDELGARVRPLLVSGHDVPPEEHEALIALLRRQIIQRDKFISQQFATTNWMTPRRWVARP